MRDIARRRLEVVLEVVTVLLMGSLALVVVVGVGFRKAGAALVWYDEVASILLAWLTFYGAALAALKRAHIGFPKLVDGLSEPLRRAAIITSEIFVIGFFLVLSMIMILCICIDRQ